MKDNVRLIIDIATNRVVYFTMSESEELHLNEHVILYSYHKELPSNLTLSNCWNFRLENQTLIETEIEYKTQRRSEFEFNKATFFKQLAQRFDNLKHRCISETGYSELRFNDIQSTDKCLITNYADLHCITIDDAVKKTIEQHDQYLQSMQNIEYLREYFLMLGKLTTSTPQLMMIQEELQNRKDFTTVDTTKHIKVIDNVDIKQMLDCVNARPEDWLVNTVRQKSIKVQEDTETISLRKVTPENNLPNNHLVYHSEAIITTDLYSHYKPITEFIEKFAKEQNSEIKWINIVKLPPGGRVLPHPDYGGYYITKDRYHLVLQGQYTYVVNQDVALRAQAGNLFWFDNKLVHYSFNYGKEDRISVIFDLQPNDQSNLKSIYGVSKILPQLETDSYFVENNRINKLKKG
jgi:hypothetical protein